MKKKLLLLAITLGIGFQFCSAQSIFAKKCKEETDPFTNEKVLSYNHHNKIVYFEYKQDTIIFELRVNYKGEINVSIPAGTKLLFKLKSGEILKLKTYRDAYPKTNATSSTIYSSFQFAMGLTKEQLEKLASEKMKQFRYPDPDGGYIDQKLNFINCKVIMKGAKCIYERM